MARKEILVAGTGGQGILFFGKILSLAAAQREKRVVSTSSYGAAVRGGDVNCGIIISDEEIHNPLLDDADIIVALSEAALKKYGHRVKQEGTLICEESENTSAVVSSFNKRFQLISIPLHDLGTKRYHNMVAMGVCLECEPDLTFDLIKEAVIKTLGKKGNERLIKENLDAIKAGGDWYLSEKKKQRGED